MYDRIRLKKIRWKNRLEYVVEFGGIDKRVHKINYIAIGRAPPLHLSFNTGIQGDFMQVTNAV